MTYADFTTPVQHGILGKTVRVVTAAKAGNRLSKPLMM
jgi:hypothetical protein